MFICDFEIVPPDDDSGIWEVWPLVLPGATQGTSFEDAVAMAADWLLGVAKGPNTPDRPALGHEPTHGGSVVTVAVPGGTEVEEEVLDAIAYYEALRADDRVHLTLDEVMAAAENAD